MSSTDHHNRPIAHHFDSYKQQSEAGTLGIWLFLCTEILMFGGLFVGYVLYHSSYPEIFKAGAAFLDWKKGSINTVILLISSFTMAMAIYQAQKNQLRACRWSLALTLLCGFLFMFIKYLEYSHKMHEGIFPGRFFSYTGEGSMDGLGLYFSFYYLMTGLHASHVLAGMALIGWALYRVFKNKIGPHHFKPLEYVGLFWHLVDLIWIYLFPLLYLVD